MSATSQGFLNVNSVESIYGEAILALQGVSLSVPEGSIVALLGANGAGKTTTLKAISNLLSASRGSITRGTITWRGKSILGLDPAELVRQGIVQVLEGRHCFPQLTVEENLLAGGFVRRLGRGELRKDLERVYTWFPRLKDRRRSRAGLLSGGEQQMVAIGRAMMTRPVLVLLDEPSMGLAPMIVEEIFEIIRRLNRDDSVTFLLAEQNANLVLHYADYGFVLENGRVVTSGPSAELVTSSDFLDFYLGGGPTAASPHSSAAGQA
jgi:branched-chain amino acid transport system ATP-binding protein